jgi:hypothetical protein
MYLGAAVGVPANVPHAGDWGGEQGEKNHEY